MYYDSLFLLSDIDKLQVLSTNLTMYYLINSQKVVKNHVKWNVNPPSPAPPHEKKPPKSTNIKQIQL